MEMPGTEKGKPVTEERLREMLLWYLKNDPEIQKAVRYAYREGKKLHRREMIERIFDI